jgi:hypothetical protein
MEYEVTIDFGDDAIKVPHICKNLTDLGLYLERIPSMFGFEATGMANVKIATKSTRRKTHNKETQTA